MGVLATIDTLGLPHTRTIAIREVNEKGVSFFTQQGSAKVQHLKNNKNVSLTIVLPNKKRQITFDGKVTALSDYENTEYWKTYHEISRVRFMVYGSKSGQIILNNDSLDKELDDMIKNYNPELIEKRPKDYVGYRVNSEIIKMYQLNDDRMSDAYLIRKKDESWHIDRVCP
jgi:pyridoxamine 5'-phosphate oxidase